MSTPAQDWPLTCQYCRHAPATHLLVADLTDVHATHLVCWPCSERSLPDARKISRSRASAWLFRLVPVLTQEPPVHRCSNDCEHAIRAVDNRNQRWTGGRPS